MFYYTGLVPATKTDLDSVCELPHQLLNDVKFKNKKIVEKIVKLGGDKTHLNEMKLEQESFKYTYTHILKFTGFSNFNYFLNKNPGL